MHVTLSFFQAIVLGFLQGITELFPVSSLGHGVLVPALLGWHNLVSSQSATQSFFLTFLVGLHFGTAVGLLAYFRGTWLDLWLALVAQIRLARRDGASALWRVKDEAVSSDYRLLFLLATATVPVLVVGALLEKPLRELFAKPLAAAIFLFVNGLVLVLGEALKRSQGRRARFASLDTLSTASAFTIGCAQISALFAGISRSGVSIVAGMTRGLDHEESANFAFLLGTPVIFAAALYKLPSLLGHAGSGVRLQTLVGALCAMVASYVSVAFLSKWFTTKTLRPFAMYCLVVGVLCMVRFA